MKIGLHCNYWNGTGAEKEPFRLLELTAQTGADSMDFSTAIALQMTSEERHKFAKEAQKANIYLTLNGGIKDAQISHSDPAIRKLGLQQCRKALEACADLNCSIWSGIIYAPWLGMPDGPLTVSKKEDIWKRAVASLQELCDFAEPLGIDICIEIVNRFEAYLINTSADGLRFTADVGRTNIKLLLDVFHMNIEEDRICSALSLALKEDKMAHLHASESNRRLPGLVPTDMDWRRIMKTLTDYNYSGSLILESMVLSQAPAAYGFRTWRDLSFPLTEEGLIHNATNSISFLRSLL